MTSQNESSPGNPLYELVFYHVFPAFIMWLTWNLVVVEAIPGLKPIGLLGMWLIYYSIYLIRTRLR